MLGAITEKEVRKLLSGLADHLEHVDRAALKELVSGIVERIELNPQTMECRLHYRINAGGFCSPACEASPRSSYGRGCGWRRSCTTDTKPPITQSFFGTH